MKHFVSGIFYLLGILFVIEALFRLASGPAQYYPAMWRLGEGCGTCYFAYIISRAETKYMGED